MLLRLGGTGVQLTPEQALSIAIPMALVWTSRVDGIIRMLSILIQLRRVMDEGSIVS